eukprot:COSAG01_NODE_70494_length_258_cov_0.962264_1_plen_24_part_10
MDVMCCAQVVDSEVAADRTEFTAA